MGSAPANPRALFAFLGQSRAGRPMVSLYQLDWLEEEPALCLCSRRRFARPIESRN